jgi:ribosomal protein L37AE/L43A
VAVVDDQIFVSSGDLLACHPGDLAHRGPHASQALLNLLRRRRTKQAFGDDEPTRPCPRCGIPLVRIERWDKRVWAQCHRCRTAPATSPVSAAVPDRTPQNPPPALNRLPRPRTAPTLCPSCGRLPTAGARCSCS